jgi:hypothetical protein
MMVGLVASVGPLTAQVFRASSWRATWLLGLRSDFATKAFPLTGLVDLGMDLPHRLNRPSYLVYSSRLNEQSYIHFLEGRIVGKFKE